MGEITKQANEIRKNVLRMVKENVYIVQTWASSNADLIGLPGLVSLGLLRLRGKKQHVHEMKSVLYICSTRFIRRNYGFA